MWGEGFRGNDGISRRKGRKRCQARRKGERGEGSVGWWDNFLVDYGKLPGSEESGVSGEGLGRREEHQ